MKKNLTYQKYQFYWKTVEQPGRIITGFFEDLIYGKNKTPKRINKFVKKHRYEIMLDMFEICRLLGWTDSYDDDYYYVLQRYRYGKEIKNSIILSSCIGRPIPIKHRIPMFDYYQLEHQWELNTYKLEDVLEELKNKKFEVK